MKVQIKDIRSGKVKTVEKRFADILIKMKTAELYEEPIKKAGTYQTKVMTAEPVKTTADQVTIRDQSEVPVEQPPVLDIEPEQVIEPDKDPLESDKTDTEPKRRGRPPKSQTYGTKVMTPEE